MCGDSCTGVRAGVIYVVIDVLHITPLIRDILLDLKNEKVNSFVCKEYTQDILRKQWNKMLKLIDFADVGRGKRLTPHLLRHVYSQSLLDMGVTLEDISSLLGHSDLRITQQRYAMFARPDLHSKAEKISNVIRFKRAV